MKILYVEDDRQYAELIEAMLNEAEVVPLGNVIWAATVAEAKLKLLEHTDFDVMLLDLGLPDSKGVDTLESLVNGVPVIVFTGNMDREMIKKAASFGVRDYLIKAKTTGTDIVRSLLRANEDSQRLRRFSRAIASVNAAMQGVVERAALL